MAKASRPIESRPPAHPPELEQVVAALQRLRGVIVPEMIQAWVDLNVTMPQFHVLHAIWRRGQLSGRQLARELGVTPGAVVALCDRLEEQGYVQRVRDRTDRRIWWLLLTPSGRTVFERLASVPRSRLVPALVNLSERDRQDLVRVLENLATALAADHGAGAGREPACPEGAGCEEIVAQDASSS